MPEWGGRLLEWVRSAILGSHTQTEVKKKPLQGSKSMQIAAPPPECFLTSCMAASVCLPAITHGLLPAPLPAYGGPLNKRDDTSFGGGGMVCHFLSSVHRAAVITEARARLFRGTLCVGRGGDSQVLLSVWSVLLFSPPIVFFPFLQLTSLNPPPHPLLVLTDTLIAVLISPTRPQFLLTISGRCQQVIVERNKVPIAVGFLLFIYIFIYFLASLLKTTVPSRRALIGCRAGKAMCEIQALTVLCFSRKPKCCLFLHASSSRLSEGGEPEKKAPPPLKRKKKLEQQREKGVVWVTIKASANGWRENRRDRSCLLINKALSFRRKTAIISHPTASSLPVSLKVTHRH